MSGCWTAAVWLTANAAQEGLPFAMCSELRRPQRHALIVHARCLASCPTNRGAAADDDGNDDDPFLDGVRYHLVACTPPEEADLGRIGRLGGATRYPGLASQLTHIVVSS